MKVDSKKPQPSDFRQDLLRGIRWGMILLIAMLLSIAAYRVLSSSPATASESKSAVAASPALEVESTSDRAVGAVNAESKPSVRPQGPEVSGWEVPAAPRKNAKPSGKAPVRTTPQIVEPPQRLHAPAFTPQPSIAPVAKANANAFIADPTPVTVDAPSPGVEIPSPKSPTLAPPPVEAAEKSKDGNRATRAVRSVGRLFRFGKKDNEAKQGDASK